MVSGVGVEGGGEDAWIDEEKERMRNRDKIVQALDCMVFMVSENDTIAKSVHYSALKSIHL